MNTLMDKIKWAITHAAWLIAGLIVAIDPKHIDKFAESHPQWSGLILALWALISGWANKPKPVTQPDMSQAGQNPANSTQKQVYMQGRRP